MSSGLAANFQQKMSALRLEADENLAKSEELKKQVKALELDNTKKEQEITSLTHRNQLLETEVEKLEEGIKEAKAAASEGAQAGQQTESLTRRLQLLEEEAEKSDVTLRETSDKYGLDPWLSLETANTHIDSVKPTSRLVISNERFKLLRRSVMTGRANTKRCRRSTQIYRKNCTNLNRASETFKQPPSTSTTCGNHRTYLGGLQHYQCVALFHPGPSILMLRSTGKHTRDLEP